jgi:hypothetical protein
MLAQGERGRRIEATPQACELALTGQPANLLRVQAERLGLLQAEDAGVPDGFRDGRNDVSL